MGIRYFFFVFVLWNSFCFGSEERLVGQLLLPYLPGEVADESMAELIDRFQPGGVILYSWTNGLTSPDQVRELTSGMQRIAHEKGLPPLLIGVDQEGGRVQRLKQGFIDYPSNAEEASGSLEEVCSRAAAVAEELRSVGINLNFAPVVDINSNPDNPVIGDRSYGAAPLLVASLGAAATEGFRKGGVISCLKHFPGHGDVSVDSHESLPYLMKSREELEECELYPFRAILNDSPVIMSAHIRMPALDPDHCATLSHRILTELLREECGYDGLICSDSIVMQGLLEECGDLGEAAVQAIEAGCDLLVVGGRHLLAADDQEHLRGLEKIQDALIQALHTGRLTEERLRESVARVALLKKAYCSDVE